MFTIYYSQIDEQLKKINQIMRIALRLRFFFNESQWIFLLLTFQSKYNNNFVNMSRVFNEIVYDFKTNDVSRLLTTQNSNINFNFLIEKSIYRIKTQNAIIWVATKIKT